MAFRAQAQPKTFSPRRVESQGRRHQRERRECKCPQSNVGGCCAANFSCRASSQMQDGHLACLSTCSRGSELAGKQARCLSCVPQREHAYSRPVEIMLTLLEASECGGSPTRRHRFAVYRNLSP